jgi:spore photoproduct lyase
MPFIQSQLSVPSQPTHDRAFGTNEHPHILHYFRKTPESIVCPHFWELRWAYGCPYDCAYCYLRGTFRGNKEPRYVNLDEVLLTLDYAFKDETLEPSIFNSGELADSLMNPKIMEKIVDKFEEQNKHKLLLLTKGIHDLSKIDFLIRKPRKQTILSLSLNAHEVWNLWEHLTPSPEKRVEIAKIAMEAGYEVRIRIDPIFPIANLESHYENLVHAIFSELPSYPDRITLGTPRGLAKTLIFATDRSWEKIAFTDKPDYTGWGKKAPESTRKEIYQFFYDKLSSLGFDKSRIAICKETRSMWNELGMEPKDCRCNCIW